MGLKEYLDDNDEPVPGKLVAKVHKWMVRHKDDFLSCTSLAEEAADEFDLLSGGPDDVDIPDWIFDMAAELSDEDEDEDAEVLDEDEDED